MKRLLLISCSDCKHTSPEPLSAIERYNGMVYRIMRKARREGYWPRNTDVLIVSAQYGLISEDTPIGRYDQKMTKARSLELQQSVSCFLDEMLKEGHYDEIFINVGKMYMQSVSASTELDRVRSVGLVKEAAGGIGMRLQQTKDWIRSQWKLDSGS